LSGIPQPDGLHNYQINVIETIKGKFAKSDVLEMMGGTHRFSDGSIVR
jgi:hypothetical protein